MSTVCLTMMVKDEAAAIERCCRSALPFIDRYVILDTGSTDRTKEIIRETLDGIPGEIFDGEFVNFGVTRSVLMAHANATHSEYLLLLDADMQVVYEPGGRLPDLTAPVYEGRLKTGPIDYALPFLVRNDRAWRYDGVAHSYLASDTPWDSEQLPGLRIIDGSHTTQEKILRDLELLSAEHTRNPLDARTAFYLAQTYYDLDMHAEAIAMYRLRAHLDGWDEETFYARYRLGSLLCEHVSFAAGAQELLAAWEMRPWRIEPLRVLANAANSVADKYPLPVDRLFVGYHHYLQPEPELKPLGLIVPEFRPISPSRLRRRARVTARRGLDPRDVSAIIVTRGNVDLEPILATLPYDDIVVWNNAEREHDLKVFGRYAAIPETRNPVVYWQDDDVVFTAHDELLKAYEPGRLVCNMDQGWIDGAGYGDFLGMVGAGSLCDATIPAEIFARYLAKHPFDDDLLLECDFAFGTMAPFKRVDLGYEPRPFTDDADRLYQQPGQTERKWRMIDRGRAMREETIAA